MCFKNGVFPDLFKKSLIHPIHKGGNRDVVGNYRPISVLPALSKILEKLMNSRLTNYLEKENLISNSQFGFRAGRSTEDAVSSLTEYIVDLLDNKRKCIGIFLDLAKAFDTVSIPILLSKMENIGIRGQSLEIFSDYLTNRTQRVKIGNLTSSDLPVTFGVPQGSVLGPSLFLIYINELCLHTPVNGRIFSFADDTALVYEGETWMEARNNAETGLQKVNGERNPEEVYKDFRAAILQVLGAVEEQSNGGVGAGGIPGEIVGVEPAPPNMMPRSLPQEPSALPVPVAEPLSLPAPVSVEPTRTVTPKASVIRVRGAATTPPLLFVVGGPGSNKAALCQRAAPLRQGWTHFSLGQRLRALADAGGGLGSDGALARAAVSGGSLAPRDLVSKLVRAAVTDSGRSGHGLVLDSYPRDLEQLEAFEKEVCRQSV
ncbi:unnamed protein product [Plutella xylostella]|uniref:(diamondback moth) hypothetical protein n=1 Tax=Plutella xylostella TaxID=51655 RepID=A0A8S4F1L7_PLUXY|nr:unnamed protein product [Plutella xylostella]